MGSLKLGSVTCRLGCFGVIIAEAVSCTQRFGVLQAISLVYWLTVLRVFWVVAGKFARAQDSGERMIPVPINDWIIIVLARSVVCVIGIVGYVLGEIEASLGVLPIIGGSESFTEAEAFRAVMQLLLMVGAYLLTNYHPKGPSVVRHLAKRLKTSRLPGRAPVTSPT